MDKMQELMTTLVAGCFLPLLCNRLQSSILFF
jgi:hypothetical protein